MMAADFRYGYAEQKFFEAVYALVGDENLQVRLGYALQPISLLSDGQIPPSLREQVIKLRTYLRDRIEYRSYDGRPWVKTRAPKSAALAGEIFEIYCALHSRSFE